MATTMAAALQTDHNRRISNPSLIARATS